MSVVPASRPSPSTWVRGIRPRLSLPIRAGVFVGAIVLAFTALLIFTADALLKNSIQRKEGSHFEYLALAISNRIDSTLDEFRRQLQAAAAGPERYAAGAGSSTFAAQRIALDELKNARLGFTWTAFIDRDGQVVMASDNLMEGTSVALRPWFIDMQGTAFSVRAEKWPALDNALGRNDTGDEPSQRVFLAVRLTNETGGFGGALVAQLGWNWVRQAQQSVIPDFARATHLGATIYAGPTEVIVDSGGLGGTLPPDAPDIPNQRAAHGMKLEKTDVGEFLTGYARCAKYVNVRWVVAVRQSSAEVFAPVTRLARSIAPWALLFAIGGAGLSAWFAYRLTRRMRSVKLAAQRIQEGDPLTAMPMARDGSEIEEMCEALHQLVEQLRK